MKKGKSLAEFETTHGAGKIAKLEREVEVERRKVEALAEVQNKVTIERHSSDEIVFGLTGDRHVGSLYHHSSALTSFYEYMKSEGVSTCYDVGDLLDGHSVYRGQEFELRDVGLDKQLDRFAQFDSLGITTKFITGNHDQSFKHLAGVHVGHAIEEKSKDGKFVFLGEEQARVDFKTPNGKFTLMLLHPGGGSSYALSYRAQKIVESLEGGTKPNLLAIGHYHKAMLMPTYRNITTIQTGTLQKQTPFMARNGLAAHVGAWIIRVRVGKDHSVIKSEFIAFF